MSMNIQEIPITIGIRDIRFKEFIISLLSKGRIKSKYIEQLLDEESMDLYAKAFTNPTADANVNYEILVPDYFGQFVEDNFEPHFEGDFKFVKFDEDIEKIKVNPDMPQQIRDYICEILQN